MCSMFCQAGGTSMRTARNRLIPPASSTSSILSILEESDPARLTRGLMASISGSSEVSNLLVRASAQLRLPSMVLISPLCASSRNGWASGQRGAVLVEKRWWKTQMAVSRRSSPRSG